MLVVALYIAYTKMDVMFGHLKNSPFVMNRTALIRGAWGRPFEAQRMKPLLRISTSEVNELRDF